MSAPDVKHLLEEPLLSQLAKIERQIAELEGEKLALQRLITTVRQRNLPVRDVTRKSSFGRILVENKILTVLRERGSAGASIDVLFKEAWSVSFDLKNSTFRSYLHRMKGRGLIERRGYGRWALPKSRET